ncbi:MAG: imidazoleglycerol-phosphate dehydratase, partial [Actinomycetota bacterium]|nr:imidazoleglycerol-phosphate dehydratase [Actinomycetota bacterium]
MTRTATVTRKTGETKVSVELSLDGGEVSASTGVGFLDHMLDLLGRHGRLGLHVEAQGDLETGGHHTVEDVGIALGQAIDEALGDRSRIRRYGYTRVPMDESLGACAIDISGRPLCVFEAELPPVTIAGFDAELAEEFFRAVASSSRMT